MIALHVGFHGLYLAIILGETQHLYAPDASLSPFNPTYDLLSRTEEVTGSSHQRLIQVSILGWVPMLVRHLAPLSTQKPIRWIAQVKALPLTR